MVKLKKIINLWAEWRIHVGIGQGHFYDIKNAMLMGASAAVILKLAPSDAVWLSVIIYFIFFFVGWIDIHKLGLMQVMNVLGTKKYNPHLRNIAKR